MNNPHVGICYIKENRYHLHRHFSRVEVADECYDIWNIDIIGSNTASAAEQNDQPVVFDVFSSEAL